MKEAIRFLHFASVFCLAFGGCNLYASKALQEKAAKLPRLTCDQILRKGPGTDEYVIVTDVRPCSRVCVYWSTGGGDISVDEYFYLPVYPAGAAKEPENRDVTFLFFATDRHVGLSLIGQPAGTEVECMVGKASRELDAPTQELLKARYPGLRVRDCWLLTTHFREPMSERAKDAYWSGIGFLVVGVLLVAGALL